jgi:dienelactone hydrolase
MKLGWIALAGLAVVTMAKITHAEIKTETIQYKAGQVEAKGFLAYEDNKAAGKRPGIVIVPEWWGLTDYAKNRAKQLAQLGYVAFAADMYGDGQTTDDPKQAGKWAGGLKAGDRKEMRIRVAAALEELKKNPNVDTTRTAVIGYCFGGTTALELARGGAAVNAVISFHGDLSTPQPAEAGKIKAKVLICHGADDTFESPQQIAEFQEEMRKAGVDWQMNTYSKAVHAFTNPDADRHGIPGIAYNKEADRRSFEAMIALFNEVFGAAASSTKPAAQASR